MRAYVGLGANLGDARTTLTEAVAALEAIPGVGLRGVSGLYRTRPVGVIDQPDFLNAVVALDVERGADPPADATAVLVALKDIERAFGRRQRERWGPREVDLDLLLYGWHRISVERPPEAAPRSAAVDPAAATRLLEVPHPSMRERLFVLAPLADLAPDLVPPGWEESVEAARRRRSVVEGRDAVELLAAWSDAQQAWIGPSGDPFTVEPARPEDAEEAAAIHAASAEAAYRDIVGRDPGLAARRLAMWRRVLSDTTDVAFVARDRGRIVGVLLAGPELDGGPGGQLQVLYVLQPWWGSGAAQALLDHAHALLGRSYDEATLTVLATNARARRFYERNGWQYVESLVEEHLGGRLVEVARYRRRLPRGRA